MAIHVVQANPAMDRIEVLEALDVGSVNRSSEVFVVPGGKGLNVARALRRLNQPVAAYGFLGGMAGAFLHDACRQLGILDRHVQVAGETRICAILVDRARRLSTVINEPGPVIDEDAETRLLRSVVDSSRRDDLVIIAGSLAPGMRPDFYGRLVAAVQSAGARAVVDTSGQALEATLDSGPWMVKANARELEEIGVRVDEWPSRLGARTEWVVMTRGDEGAIARSRASAWHATAPSIGVVNATGAGDVFLAALMARLSSGDAMAEALRFAAAAGAGSATSLLPELPGEATLAGLLDRTKVAEIRS